jgi:hypothetical protein
MKSRWLLIVGLCGAVAALVMVVRAWRPVPTPNVPQEGEKNASRLGDRSRLASGDLSRRRLQPEKAGAPSDAGKPGGDIAERRAVGRRPDLPSLGDRLPRRAEAGGEDNAAGSDDAERRSFSSATGRVFDLGSRVELSDAGELSGDAGTVSFWIEPQWSQDSKDGANFVQLGELGLEITKSGTYLRFQDSTTSDTDFGGGIDISQWQPGDWHHVTATWRGNALALYVDGQQVFLNHGLAQPNFDGRTKLYVGSDSSGGVPVANGQLHFLTVLNHDASNDEVQRMFEADAPPGG